MICAIVLAAGRSCRMGTQKLLLPFGSNTVIERVVDEILQSGVSEVFVVIAKGDARIADTLRPRRVRFVENPEPDSDMLSSVRCGLRALPPQAESVLIALGDQPTITARLIREMAGEFSADCRGILVPVHAGQRGHPLLFSANYRDEILEGLEGGGLRGLLDSHPNEVRELPVATPAVLTDLDTPEDYQRALAELEKVE